MSSWSKGFANVAEFNSRSTTLEGDDIPADVDQATRNSANSLYNLACFHAGVLMDSGNVSPQDSDFSVTISGNSTPGVVGPDANSVSVTIAQLALPQDNEDGGSQ